jgi:DNA-binding IclR family transcriptional regulator
MAFLDPSSYSVSEAYQVLDSLGRNGQCKVLGLALSLGLSTSAMTGLVNAMESLGWVYIAEDRSGWVAISPAGERLNEARETTRQAYDAWNDQENQ